jgi:hypothetical protein
MDIDLDGYVKRVQQCLWLIPEGFFPAIVKDKGFRESFAYLLFLMIIATPIDVAVELLTAKGVSLAGTAFVILAGFIVAPILMYFTAGLTHAFIKLLGGKSGYLQTVQLLIYGQTGMTVLGSVPVVGMVFALVAVVNMVKGTQRIHGLSLLRSVAAVLVLPLLLLLALGFLIAKYFTIGA